MRGYLCQATALLLAAAAPQVHAACSSLTASIPVVPGFVFAAGSTSGAMEQKIGSVTGSGCSNGNKIAAYLTSNNSSTTGAGIATRTGGGTLKYQLLRSTATSDPWGNQNASYGIGVNPSGGAFTAAFYVGDGGNTGVFPLAGSYSDTVTVTLEQGSNPVASTSFLLSIQVPDQCVVAGLSNMSLTYTSFSPQPVETQMSFSVNTNTDRPYTLSLSPASVVAGDTPLGLAYGLTLDSASGAGNAVAHAHTVTARVPAGQSGICSNSLNGCSYTNTHTLTVTY